MHAKFDAQQSIDNLTFQARSQQLQTSTSRWEALRAEVAQAKKEHRVIAKGRVTGALSFDDSPHGSERSEVGEGAGEGGGGGSGAGSVIHSHRAPGDQQPRKLGRESRLSRYSRRKAKQGASPFHSV